MIKDYNMSTKKKKKNQQILDLKCMIIYYTISYSSYE